MEILFWCLGAWLVVGIIVTIATAAYANATLSEENDQLIEDGKLLSFAGSVMQA